MQVPVVQDAAPEAKAELTQPRAKQGKEFIGALLSLLPGTKTWREMRSIAIKAELGSRLKTFCELQSLPKD